MNDDNLMDANEAYEAAAEAYEAAYEAYEAADEAYEAAYEAYKAAKDDADDAYKAVLEADVCQTLDEYQAPEPRRPLASMIEDQGDDE